jgi:hypothetical protein
VGGEEVGGSGVEERGIGALFPGGAFRGEMGGESGHDTRWRDGDKETGDRWDEGFVAEEVGKDEHCYCA